MAGKKLYKFMRKGLKSANGHNYRWKIGKWKTIKGKLEMCANGLHASRQPLDALGYVKGDILAVVEVAGKSIICENKECWQKMRVIKAYYWTKRDSVALAIYAASLVIGVYEERYPKDNRPRRAILAAKAWLKNPTEKNRSAALSASLAAWLAGKSAAKPASLAAEPASLAAESAVLKKINTWIKRRINQLEPYGDGRDG